MIAEEKQSAATPESLKRDVQFINSIGIIPELLNVICRTTGMRFAAVARVTDTKWIACSVQDEIQFGITPGDELDLKTTLCNEIRQSGKPIIIDHVANDPDFCDHHTPAMYGFQSYISMPIFRKNGEFFGTLCAIDPDPHSLKTEQVTDMFRLFTDLISFHLNAADEAEGAAVRLEAERALHRKMELSEEKLSVVIDANELGIWEVDFKTDTIICSDRYLKITGLPHGSVISWEDARKNLFTQDLPVRAAAFEEAMQTGRLSYIGRMHIPGGGFIWIEAKGKIFFDEESKPLNMIGTIRDITEEKNSATRLEEKVQERTQELNEKNDELEKANKELQSFAYISSHDLQEPLRKIQTFVSLIEAEEAGSMSDKIKDYFRRMKNAAERMQLLIVDLLAYSRASTEEKQFEKDNIADIVNQVTENLREELDQKNAKVTVDADFSFDMIPFQLNQLFQNLISNSINFHRLRES